MLASDVCSETPERGQEPQKGTKVVGNETGKGVGARQSRTKTKTWDFILSVMIRSHMFQRDHAGYQAENKLKWKSGN